MIFVRAPLLTAPHSRIELGMVTGRESYLPSGQVDTGSRTLLPGLVVITSHWGVNLPGVSLQSNVLIWQMTLIIVTLKNNLEHFDLCSGSPLLWNIFQFSTVHLGESISSFGTRAEV